MFNRARRKIISTAVTPGSLLGILREHLDGVLLDWVDFLSIVLEQIT